MGYKLFLDDIRVPVDCLLYISNQELYKNNQDWVIVRNYYEFINIIRNKGIPDVVSFDHDLATEHYHEMNKGTKIDYDTASEKTGYHCAQWLINHCIDNEFDLPKDIHIHSMNFYGGQNIKSLFNSYLKAYKK